MSEQWVLQFCHGYDGPFLDCARQYAALFEGTRFKVTTVYLTGEPDERVRKGSASDDVIFLGYGSKAVRGLKLGAIRDIKRIVAEREYAFCIAHRSKPTYVALLGTKLPVIGVHHAFGDFERRSRRTFANLFRKRLSLLAVSDAVRDDVRACLPDWPEMRIQTLHNRTDVAALEAEHVPRATARAHLGLPSEAWVIGNVGRLHPDKDQKTLIEGFARALPRLPTDSLLVIAGEGRLEQPLKMLANHLGVSERVRFVGQIPAARRYFTAFDAFALTSDHEPFGMVLLEAMAAKIPVVCSDCGGAPEVVGDTGWLFPFADATQLAERFVDIAGAGAGELKAKGMAAWSRAQTLFSDSHARLRFAAIYPEWSLEV